MKTINMTTELHKKIKIALADDHGILRAGLIALMDDHEYLNVVTEARDGEELLSKMAFYKPDLLIIDLTMPRMDGLSAIDELQKDYPNLKIIVLTMHKNKAIFKQAMARKVNGYILKDEVSESLISAITQVMRGEQYISRDMLYMLVDDIQQDQDDTILVHLLTQREKEVLSLVAQGMTSRGIAKELNISARTVEGHRASIREKLHITDLAGLIKFAQTNGLLK